MGFSSQPHLNTLITTSTNTTNENLRNKSFYIDLRPFLHNFRSCTRLLNHLNLRRCFWGQRNMFRVGFKIAELLHFSFISLTACYSEGCSVRRPRINPPHHIVTTFLNKRPRKGELLALAWELIVLSFMISSWQRAWKKVLRIC